MYVPLSLSRPPALSLSLSPAAETLPRARTQPLWQYAPRQLPGAKLLYRNVKRLRGGLVFKAHRRVVSLNSRLEELKKKHAGFLEGYSVLVLGAVCSFLEPFSN